MKPTTMLFRNLMAMDVEECIRAYPLDAVVLLSGCDKTTPAMLMGAASADVPAIMVTGGPDAAAGAGAPGASARAPTRASFWASAARARSPTRRSARSRACLSRSAGHCMVMGTASTMAAMAEALGMTLPGNAAIPAADSRRLALAEMSGRRAVEMAARGPQALRDPDRARRSTTRSAPTWRIGGSTNAIVHLVAIAGRAGVPLPLRRFDELSRTTPLLANVRPVGQVPDGGFLLRGRACRRCCASCCRCCTRDALTVTGQTLRREHRRGAVPQHRRHPPARRCRSRPRAAR